MARTKLQSDRQAEYVCPACKQPVATTLARHKTLGIYVPHWGPGPCHNPECHSYEAESGASSGAARDLGSVGR
ncbi:hypothetical protein [Streptomyces sp. HB132]|uniref:hypothetical protein n=1 Tax=Streptomyces sp. HB132 TaxID=767388 RepID=UPI0019612E5E|nr:hypothetical protein [Streptomyces sp. HB132]MBM7437779.1 hypothetical protein [Streptomyces sp. HB132]